MAYSHLSQEDRRIISRLRSQGKSLRFIAGILGVSHSTVSREIGGRTSGATYCPAAAQQIAQCARAAANASRSKLKPPHTEFIRSQLELTLSPEQIASLFPARFGFSISTRALYTHIRKADELGCGAPAMRQHLRLRSRVHRKVWRLYHGPCGSRPNISQRPAEADERSAFGHWEMDLFIGPRGDKTSALVLVERKSRYSLIRRLPDQTQASVVNALGALTPGLLIRSITTDNGTEFLNHETLAELIDAPVFYCNPYHAWEKGSVENTIGLYREFFRKGQPIPEEPELFSRAEHLINSRPRKVLGFRTALSLLDKITTHTKI